MRPEDHEMELEPQATQPWCSKCEHWDEDCSCEDPETSTNNATNETRGDKPSNDFLELKNRIDAYWKEKAGHCLACDTDIALEDQYCPSCYEFLAEVHHEG